MEIGASQAVAATTHQVAREPTERQPQAESLENEKQPANSASAPPNNQNNDVSATQQVQPTNAAEASQATSNNNPPTPDPNSREGVGRFIDTLV